VCGSAATRARGPAPEGLHGTGDSIMNLPWSLAGMPAQSIPAGRLQNAATPRPPARYPPKQTKSSSNTERSSKAQPPAVSRSRTPSAKTVAAGQRSPKVSAGIRYDPRRRSRRWRSPHGDPSSGSSTTLPSTRMNCWAKRRDRSEAGPSTGTRPEAGGS